MAVKRIGLLTGGGDVPGLNSVIKSATYRSSENDIEILGLRRGWEALTHLNADDPASRAHYVIQLTRENTRKSTGMAVQCSTRVAPTPPKYEIYPPIWTARTFRPQRAKTTSRPRPGTSPPKWLPTSRLSASNT